MTDQQIINRLRAKGFPDDLTDAAIVDAIDTVLSDLSLGYSLQTYGTFSTNPDQQIYDLFSATIVPATRQGALTGGLRVLEIIGGPISGESDADVFGIAPWLQNSAFPNALENAWSMNWPGDFTLWEENWQSWSRRFGTFSFEHIESRAGSPIRITPKPTETRTVLVKYTTPRNVTDLRDSEEPWLLLFVQAACAETLANIFAATAGIKVGEMADQGKTVAYWQEMAEKWGDRARELFGSRAYDSIGLGIRS